MESFIITLTMVNCGAVQKREVVPIKISFAFQPANCVSYKPYVMPGAVINLK